MPPPIEPVTGNQDMVLGEMRGQMREVVHSLNNLTQKFDILSREVIGLAVLGAEVAALKTSVAALEADRSRRDGAVGMVEMIVKSPLVGWFVGLAVTGFAIAKGWVRVP